MTVTAHITDNAGIDTVTLDYDSTTVPMTLISGTNTDGNWRVILPGQGAGDSLTYNVTATDLDGSVSSNPPVVRLDFPSLIP